MKRGSLFFVGSDAVKEPFVWVVHRIKSRFLLFFAIIATKICKKF